MRDDL
jgi:regulator of protease activity HflC (stomatin/prohibitin superfamily)